MIDDGYRKAAALVAQLKPGLDAIRDAEPGSEAHGDAVDAFHATLRALLRHPYVAHAPVSLPRDDARG